MSEQGRQSDGVERRAHWFNYAREAGQEDDFRALIEDVRREAFSVAAAMIAKEVKAIEIGEGSEHFRHGRETMRDDLLRVLEG